MIKQSTKQFLVIKQVIKPAIKLIYHAIQAFKLFIKHFNAMAIVKLLNAVTTKYFEAIE